MTKEDLKPQEEEQSNPAEERDSEETSEEDSIFDEESDESTDSDEEIQSLKKRLENLEKGIHKAFSEQGQNKVEPSKSNPNYAEDLLLVRFPEAENVLEDAKKFAKEQGTDVLTVFKNSTFLQSEAKARAEEKRKEDEAKAKINGSSSQVGDGGLQFADIDLSNPEHKKWLNQKGRMERYKKWFSQNITE